MQSHAIFFTGPYQAEARVEEVGPPPPGQVTLESIVSLISTGTESWCYRGQFDEGTGWANWVKYPFRPGYSMVSRVVAVGEGVRDLAEGDRVFSATSHRQYSHLPAASVQARLPADANDEDASWSALAFITQTAVRRAEHQMGDTAVVIGLGLLGQLVTQYLRVAGLRRVLAIDTAEMRLDMARAHGATATFQGTADEALEWVKDQTDGRLADVVYDVTGHYAVLPQAFKLVRDFGTLLLLGDSPEPSRQTLTHDLLTRQLKLVGTHNAKLSGEAAWWTETRQIGFFLELIARGEMRVADLVTHRFGPEDPQAVYQLLQTERATAMGVLFDWRGLNPG